MTDKNSLEVGLQTFLEAVDCCSGSKPSLVDRSGCGQRRHRKRGRQRPTVRSLVLGTPSRWLDDERRRWRESMSAAHWRSLARYLGAMLCRQRTTSTTDLYLMRPGTDNLCSSWSSGDMWSSCELGKWGVPLHWKPTRDDPAGVCECLQELHSRSPNATTQVT